jgi:hypothetical protein
VLQMNERAATRGFTKEGRILTIVIVAEEETSSFHEMRTHDVRVQL